MTKSWIQLEMERSLNVNKKWLDSAQMSRNRFTHVKKQNSKFEIDETARAVKFENLAEEIM